MEDAQQLANRIFNSVDLGKGLLVGEGAVAFSAGVPLSDPALAPASDLTAGSDQLTRTALRLLAELKQAEAQNRSAAQEQAALEPERVAMDDANRTSMRNLKQEQHARASAVQAASKELERAHEFLKAKQAEQEACNKEATKREIENAKKNADLCVREHAAKEACNRGAKDVAQHRLRYTKMEALRRQKLEEEKARLKACRPLLQAKGEWVLVSGGDKACDGTPPHPANFADPGTQAVGCTSSLTPAVHQQMRSREALKDAAKAAPTPLKRPRDDGASTGRGVRTNPAKTLPGGPGADGGEAGPSQLQIQIEPNQIKAPHTSARCATIRKA